LGQFNPQSGWVFCCETCKAPPAAGGDLSAATDLRHRSKDVLSCVQATDWQCGPEMGGFDKMAILNEF
jgi:hypothetical protein